MALTKTKGTALGLGAILITWGIQTAMTDLLAGGVGVALGLLIVIGYQVAEEHDHDAVYNEIVAEIGEDNLKALSEASAGELRKILEHVRNENDNNPN